MAKSKLPWLKLRKKTQSEYPYEPPIMLGNKSNGEFFQAQTPTERKMRDLILRKCDDNARKLGMERREFIASAMGMCTSLSVLNLAAGCGDKGGNLSMKDAMNMLAGREAAAGSTAAGSGGWGGSGSGGSGGSAGAPLYNGGSGGWGGAGSGGAGSGGAGSGAAGSEAGMGGSPGAPAMGPNGECADWCATRGQPDGGFCVPHEATLDCDMARALVGGKEFIFDLQTHHVNDRSLRSFPLSGCTLNDMIGHVGDRSPLNRTECTWPDAYVEQIFLDADTTVAVLSGLPSETDRDTGDLTWFSNKDMYDSVTRVNAAAASQRMINHCQVGADYPDWSVVAAMMERSRKDYGHMGWKCYPGAAVPPSGEPWWLTDERGENLIRKALELNDPLICVHKGFPLPTFVPEYCDPHDVGPAATKFPGATFIIYHSAYETSVTEGPYDINGGGVDRLVKTVEAHNLKDKNVYAEMGSAWLLASMNPAGAQHYVGKMLKHIGMNRLLFGSECTWFGSPQPQIEAFRMFQISKEFQDKFGYPELTPQVKAGILGLNAAKLYCIDPSACRNTIDTNLLTALKRNKDGEFGDRRWAFQKPIINTRREFLTLRQTKRALGELG